MFTKPEESWNLKVDLNRSSYFILAELLINTNIFEGIFGKIRLYRLEGKT